LQLERAAAVDRLLEQLLVAPDPALDAALEASAAAGFPPAEVSPLQGRLLHLLARIAGARRILELGTLAGYSTIWLARALPPGGALVTVEADPRRAAVASANVAGARLADLVDVRIGEARDVLAALTADHVEPFDLVFLDADKRGNPDYLDWALRLTRPGSVIVADNVIRAGAIADDHPDDAHAAGARRFLEVVGSDSRLAATAIQTVGAKGWDGFALAVVVSG
jgi:predicted O-methyltransferase YrrM